MNKIAIISAADERWNLNSDMLVILNSFLPLKINEN